MTGAGTFISRWSRLKRKSGKERNADPTGSVTPSDAAGTSSADEDDAEVSAAPTFDPASSASFEPITASTDIRAFLLSSIPADLMRAVLRRSWVSDPAIRDFIGIAENQWDFADPTAIPGFGPLRETDDVPRLLAQALGNPDTSSTAFQDTSMSAEQPSSATIDPSRDAVADRVQQTPGILAVGPDDAQTSRSTPDKGKIETAAENDRAAHAGKIPRRAHGSALPR
jgi:hypothetical protein